MYPKKVTNVVAAINEFFVTESHFWLKIINLLHIKIHKLVV